MIEPIGCLIGTDMTMEEKNLPILHLGIAFFQTDPTFPNGFYLAPQKRNPRFKRFEKFVVEKSFFILGNDFCLRLFSHNRGSPSRKEGRGLDNRISTEEQKEKDQESTWVILSSKQLESISRT
jgi:hypothetical protein